MITNTPHFEFIQASILKELDDTEEHVIVAVAWLTDSVLYHKLYSLCRKGKKVELLLNYDQINLSSGLDFEKIKEAGGQIFWEYDSDTKLMHNKYCIIDDTTIITGSYNWTNRAKSNNENIIVIKNDTQTISRFKDEFYRLTNRKNLISTDTFSVPNNYTEKAIDFESFIEWWKRGNFVELRITITERVFKRKFNFNYIPSRDEYNTLISSTALDLEWTGHLLSDYKSLIQNQFNDFDSFQAEYGYNLSGLDGIEMFPHLEYINCAANDVEDLGPLSKLPNLKYLDLSDNARIRKVIFKNVSIDLSPLRHLKKLEYLDLHWNETLKNFDSLYSLKSLKTLNISTTNATESDIKALKSHLPNCEIIVRDNIVDDSEDNQQSDYFNNDDLPF